MNEDQLRKIEEIINGEDHPGDVWFIETIQELVNEVRQLKADKPCSPSATTPGS